jgi:serine O-acetyltransferase
MADDNAADLLVSMWASIKQDAQAKARDYPLLAVWLEDQVLRHADLAAAIQALMAADLADGHVPATELAAMIAGVMTRNRDIVVAAARDLQAFVSRDPACEGYLSVLLNYKGFRALQWYRVAHALWAEGSRAIARYLQGRMALVFAIDIHPAARIGHGVFIDHGTGIVIGETTVIEDNVSLLQSVTLGGTGKVGGDRHPKIREGVMIGAGAAVLGNVEVGAGSKIAAGSVVLRPVPPHTTVAGVPAQVVGHPREQRPSLDMVQDIESEVDSG